MSRPFLGRDDQEHHNGKENISRADNYRMKKISSHYSRKNKEANKRNEANARGNSASDRQD
jgi:hypothetical protein